MRQMGNDRLPKEIEQARPGLMRKLPQIKAETAGNFKKNSVSSNLSAVVVMY